MRSKYSLINVIVRHHFPVITNYIEARIIIIIINVNVYQSVGYINSKTCDIGFNIFIGLLDWFCHVNTWVLLGDSVSFLYRGNEWLLQFWGSFPMKLNWVRHWSIWLHPSNWCSFLGCDVNWLIVGLLVDWLKGGFRFRKVHSIRTGLWSSSERIFGWLSQAWLRLQFEVLKGAEMDQINLL